MRETRSDRRQWLLLPKLVHLYWTKLTFLLLRFGFFPSFSTWFYMLCYFFIHFTLFICLLSIYFILSIYFYVTYVKPYNWNKLITFCHHCKYTNWFNKHDLRLNNTNPSSWSLRVFFSSINSAFISSSHFLHNFNLSLRVFFSIFYSAITDPSPSLLLLNS